ncbi:hypothetical protein SVAN01_00464 [Stagonosporopsis vannaccii]|nr:hypothetical protein SVAN01_00464 [Stagonosporopsis vannaccii]
MRALLFSSISIGILSTSALADCRHPNGDVQTDAYHAPCADVLNNPLNTMCCAIDRPNPSEGFAKDGITADVCLPNGLCKQVSRQDEKTPLKPVYYREECTVAGWKSGKCLSVCLSNSVSKNVMMTPCDGTANSTRWCCGENVECCSGDIGVETLAQTFLGMLTSGTSAPSSSSASASTSASNPAKSDTTWPVNSDTSSRLSGGAIAGVVIGALVGVALIGATTFFLGHRHRSTDLSPPIHVEGDATIVSTKTFYAHEADGGEPQVSEVSAANVKDHDGRTRVHEM